MTKKFFSILAVLGIAATMFLSSCTAAGVECGLIGKWEGSYTLLGVTAEYTIEITNDDKFITEVKVNGKSTKTEVTIESVSDHVIKTDEGDIKYQNLTADSVEFLMIDDWIKFSKVN